MQMHDKLADRFATHAALETKDIEGGHQQTREPTSAVFGFPQPRFRVAVSAFHGLCETMHTALGKAGLLSNAAHALLAVVTKTLENPQAFVPKSHVGLVLLRVAKLSPEFSSSAYTTDTKLSRLKRIPELRS